MVCGGQPLELCDTVPATQTQAHHLCSLCALSLHIHSHTSVLFINR